MQLDQQIVTNTFSVIGGVVFTAAAAFGVGNILLAIYHRRTGKKDKSDEIHETNRGAELEASGALQDRLLKRVDKLETDLEKMQDGELLQLEANTRLKMENEYFKKEIEWHKEEIAKLQASEAALKEQVAILTATVTNLEKEITALKK